MESALPLSSTLWAQCSGNKSHVGNTALGICSHISDPQEVRRAGCSLEASHLLRLSVVHAPRRLCLVLSSASGLLGNRAVRPLSRPVPPTPSSSLPQPLYLGPLSGLLLAPPPHRQCPPEIRVQLGHWIARWPHLPPESMCVCGCRVGGGLASPGLAHLVWWWDTDPLLTIPVPLGPWKVSGKWERMDVARTSPSSPLEREHLSKTQI